MKSKLTVFLNGAKHSETVLSGDQEYTLGRSPTCDIVLDNTEVSRQHAKVVWEEGIWKIKVLSRFGKLIVAGRPIDEVSLASGSVVSIPPFELRFFEEADAKATAASITRAEESPHLLNPEPENEKTTVGVVSTDALLIRMSEAGESTAAYPLGKGRIEAGRSRSAAIATLDPLSGRLHFAIEFKNGQYEITDLSSANGTFVNGERIRAHILRSGDEIQVGEEKFIFELRNAAFDDLQDMPAHQSGDDEVTEVAVIKMQAPPAGGDGQPQPDLPMNRKKRKLRIALGAALVCCVFYTLMNDNNKGQLSQSSKKVTGPSGAEQSAFEKLTPEQRKLVEDSYNLALNLYTSGKYEMAAIELGKVLQLVPSYRQAKDMQLKCEQASEITRQSEAMDRQKREQEQIQTKVSQILDGCAQLLKNGKYPEVEGCVAGINELDPGNARGESLINEARIALVKIDEAAAKNQQGRRQKKSAQAQYDKATALLRAKQYRQSILAFEKLLDMSFPLSSGLKSQASQKIKEATVVMHQESDAQMNEGKTALEAKDYKTAVKKLQGATELSADNDQAKTLLERAQNEVRTQMKNIYSESVLEENSGSIESAKKKWQMILDQDVPSDPYYNKAKLKLQKYLK